MTVRRAERGSAYLLLMVLLGAVAGLFTVGLAALVPPQRSFRRAAETRLADLTAVARSDYLRNGAFATSLTALATRARLVRDGEWRLDPYGSAADLRWQVAGRPSVLTATSRGVDGRLGTADDVAVRLSETVPGRVRSRDRLRLLRARLVAWQVTAGSSAMSPTDRKSLQRATRSYAAARRAYEWSSGSARTACSATMASELQTIRTLRTAYHVTLPTRVTGRRGLMRALGLADGVAVDGWARALLWDEAVGVVSRGGDNRGGTSDDF